MDPEGMDHTTHVMVKYAYELVDKNRRLEDQLKAQEATLKRYRQVIDEQRVCLNLPKMYEELPHKFHPQGLESLLCNKTLVARVKLSQLESSSAVQTLVCLVGLLLCLCMSWIFVMSAKTLWACPQAPQLRILKFELINKQLGLVHYVLSGLIFGAVCPYFNVNLNLFNQKL